MNFNIKHTLLYTAIAIAFFSSNVVLAETLAVIPITTSQLSTLIIDSPDNNINTIVQDRNYNVDSPSSVAITNDGLLSYIAYTYKIEIINNENKSIIDRFNTTLSAHNIAVDSVSKKLYVTNQVLKTVDIIDLNSKNIISTLSVGDTPTDIVLNKSGKFAYIVNYRSKTISVLDTLSKTIVSTIIIDSESNSIDINDSGTQLYVTDRHTNNIEIIDINSKKVIKKVLLDSPARSVTVNTSAYFLKMDGTIDVFDENNQLQKTSAPLYVPIPSSPYSGGIDFSPITNKLYVLTYDKMYTIDPVTLEINKSITLGEIQPLLFTNDFISPALPATPPPPTNTNNSTCQQHATYSLETSKLEIPALDILQVDPFTGLVTSEAEVLENIILNAQNGQITYQANSGSYIGNAAIDHCNSRYNYLDGSLYIPFVDIMVNIPVFGQMVNSTYNVVLEHDAQGIFSIKSSVPIK